MTPLSKIFNKFLHTIDDIELSLLEKEDVEEMLVEHLENATVSFYECTKSLEIIKPVQKRFYVEVEDSFEFDFNVEMSELSSLAIEKDGEVLCDVNDYNYTYDEDSKTLSISILNSFIRDFEVVVHTDGYINDDLDIDEIYILVLGMTLQWLSPKIKREENLRQMMNDRDFKQISNASMLNRLIALNKSSRDELRTYKRRYAFKNFKGFD